MLNTVLTFFHTAWEYLMPMKHAGFYILWLMLDAFLGLYGFTMLIGGRQEIINYRALLVDSGIEGWKEAYEKNQKENILPVLKWVVLIAWILVGISFALEGPWNTAGIEGFFKIGLILVLLASMIWLLNELHRYRQGKILAEVDGKTALLHSSYLESFLRWPVFLFFSIPCVAGGYDIFVIAGRGYSTLGTLTFIVILGLCLMVIASLGISGGRDALTILTKTELRVVRNESLEMKLKFCGIPLGSRSWPKAKIEALELRAYYPYPGLLGSSEYMTSDVERRGYEGIAPLRMGPYLTTSELFLHLKNGKILGLGFLDMPGFFTPTEWVNPLVHSVGTSLAKSLGMELKIGFYSVRSLPIIPVERFKLLADQTGKTPIAEIKEIIEDPVERRREVADLIEEIEKDLAAGHNDEGAEKVLASLRTESKELDKKLKNRTPKP